MPSLLDLETDAIADLGASIRRLRRRVLLPALAAYVVAGHLAVIAHVLGYFSLLGRLHDGSYVVTNFTVFLALLAPLLPVVGPASIVYLALRARMRDAWVREHVARGLPREAAERNVARFG
jgi:ABC-type spermidine/putrescine transport system permease subunit II